MLPKLSNTTQGDTMKKNSLQIAFCSILLNSLMGSSDAAQATTNEVHTMTQNTHEVQHPTTSLPDTSTAVAPTPTPAPATTDNVTSPSKISVTPPPVSAPIPTQVPVLQPHTTSEIKSSLEQPHELAPHQPATQLPKLDQFDKADNKTTAPHEEAIVSSEVEETTETPPSSNYDFDVLPRWQNDVSHMSYDDSNHDDILKYLDDQD
jgi:hypothetical protein